jgi:hypothetical protein
MYGSCFCPKIGKTKRPSKQVKQDDTHTNSVKINDATTIKIVDQKIAQNTPVKHSGNLLKNNEKAKTTKENLYHFCKKKKS